MPMQIKDEGTGNSYRLDADQFDAGAEIVIRGNDNTIEIGADVDLLAPKIHIQGSGNSIRLATEMVEVVDPAEECKTPFILHASSREAEIIVLGDGNSIEAGRYTEIYDSTVQIVGDDNSVKLGHRVRAHMKIDFHTTGALFEVGDHTTCVGMHAALHESRTLRLGKDCQLAADIYLTVSDTHPIYDLDTGERINVGKDVEVGDHVWLGFRTVILKGSKVGSGSTIGTCTVVAGSIPENCVAVGNPARVVKRNVTWQRELVPEPTIKAVG